MRNIIFCILIIFSLINPAFGNNIQQIENLKKNAEQGDTFCQNALAALYLEGKVIPKDSEKAIYWLKKSANQGSCFAQARLGEMYFHGEHGLLPDYKKAAQWFEKAATQEDVHSQKVLGVMYLNGKGVEKDFEKSLWWFESAASLGDTDSQYQVALMLLADINGDLEDLKKGCIWLLVAEKQGKVISKDIKKEITSIFTPKVFKGLKDSAEELYAHIQKNDRGRVCPDDESLILLHILKSSNE